MPEEQKQGHLETWAIVEVMGHQTYAGFVTTEAFGGAVLFRVEVPEIPAGEPKELEHTDYIEGAYREKGTVVKPAAMPGFTKLIGAGSIYAITPCTEEAARLQRLRLVGQPLQLVSLPVARQIDEPTVHEPEGSEGDF